MSHRTWERRITNKLNSPPVLSRLLRPHYSRAHWEPVDGEGQEAAWLTNRCPLPPQDMQHHWYAQRTRFSCSAQCQAKVTRFAYQLPLLPLIRQFVIWSSPGRHSLTGLTGIHPPQQTLKSVTSIRHSSIPGAQCTGTTAKSWGCFSLHYMHQSPTALLEQSMRDRPHQC